MFHHSILEQIQLLFWREIKKKHLVSVKQKHRKKLGNCWKLVDPQMCRFTEYQNFEGSQMSFSTRLT